MDTPAEVPYNPIISYIAILEEPKEIFFNQPFTIKGMASNDMIKSVRLYVYRDVGGLFTPALAAVSVPDYERHWEITARIDDLEQWESLDKLISMKVVGTFFFNHRGETECYTGSINKGGCKFRLQPQESRQSQLGSITVPETFEFRRYFILHITRNNKQVQIMAKMAMWDRGRYPRLIHEEESLMELDFRVNDGPQWTELERLGQFTIECWLQTAEIAEYVKFTYSWQEPEDGRAGPVHVGSAQSP